MCERCGRSLDQPVDETPGTFVLVPTDHVHDRDGSAVDIGNQRERNQTGRSHETIEFYERDEWQRFDLLLLGQTVDESGSTVAFVIVTCLSQRATAAHVQSTHSLHQTELPHLPSDE